MVRVQPPPPFALHANRPKKVDVSSDIEFGAVRPLLGREYQFSYVLGQTSLPNQRVTLEHRSEVYRFFQQKLSKLVNPDGSISNMRMNSAPQAVGSRSHATPTRCFSSSFSSCVGSCANALGSATGSSFAILVCINGLRMNKEKSDAIAQSGAEM